MKKPLFTGTATALVTPFKRDGIDFPMLEKLLLRQLENGIRAFVLCGTTGESPTLTTDEKREIFEFSRKVVRDEAVLIAGTGSNVTTHAVELSELAQRARMDGILVVTPYYNKANEDGLIAHYRMIAEAVNIPVILYNVPSRTGVRIPIKVYQKLSEIENINGVKEASGSMQEALDIRLNCPEDFYIWSGNDDITVPLMSIGAKGVISVASNVEPAAVKEMTDYALSNDFIKAGACQLALQRLIKALFCEVNPIPVKRAMQEIGLDCGKCRLPLGNIREEHIRMLCDALKK